MHYQWKACKVCGKKRSETVHISSRGKCAECALKSTVENARASVQAAASAHGKPKQRTGVRF